MSSYDKKKKNSSHQKELISFLLIFLLSQAIPTVRAQPGSNNPEYGSNQYPYAKFSPSMAIIIVVLVAALFFMGFFSIYIRRCSDASGGSIRPVLSIRRRTAAAARGLDPAVIETFPTFAYSVVKGLKIGKGALECAVCLNEFEDDETLRLIPKCDHVFHPECIDAWLNSHVTCPVCRADLVPKPGESIHLPPEFDNHNHGTVLESHQNDDVSIPVRDDYEVNNGQEPLPEVVNRNFSFKQNRPPRSRSVRSKMFPKFRSHSTGHSLVQPGENMDRFTLRLPEEVRKQVMKRAFLNRTASCVVLPREGSSRKGYRTGEGSSRGRSFKRLEGLDQTVKSDRWIFPRAAPSFFSRALSLRSPKLTATLGEGSKTAVKMPSNCLQPKGDEVGLVSSDSSRPPV